MVRNYSDTQRLTICSCGDHHHNNIPCRHIYTVFDVESGAFHCGIQEKEKLKAFYNKDKTTINYTLH